MDQLSDAQLAVATRINDALKADADIPVNLLNRINGLMQSAWAAGYSEAFGGLGNRAGALDTRLGILIGTHMMLGGSYAALPKPPVCYVKTDDGHVLPTACPFPTGGLIEGQPLRRWSIPAADLSAAQAIAGGDNGSILAALASAQV